VTILTATAPAAAPITNPFGSAHDALQNRTAAGNAPGIVAFPAQDLGLAPFVLKVGLRGG
jgi:hypothetical protein